MKFGWLVGWFLWHINVSRLFKDNSYVYKFIYRESSVSSTETDTNTWLAKTWAAIDRLSVIWKSDLTDKIKHSFLQAAVILILLYGCTTWTLTKRMEKKLDGNYTRMLRATLNKSWSQHLTKQQMYGHLPLIKKTIKVRRTRHAGHYRRSRDELISDIILWTPSHGRAKAGLPAGTYIQQLSVHTGCSPEDLPGAMDDREVCRERVREIRAGGTTWWWYIYIYIYIYNLKMHHLLITSLNKPELNFLKSLNTKFGFNGLLKPIANQCATKRDNLQRILKKKRKRKK